MTPSEILRKHEDANEMHFHAVDRRFIIEAMEEYAIEFGKQCAEHWSGSTVETEYVKSFHSHLKTFHTNIRL